MANKTLNITNNGTGTLTLGGVTIGNSSIATYNSSNKKISIVGAGTTNAAINLNYIKGSVSKNFNRNFNILGKEDANTTFRNKVKALMEEYKYAVVSGQILVDVYQRYKPTYQYSLESTITLNNYDGETAENETTDIFDGDQYGDEGVLLAVYYNPLKFSNIEKILSNPEEDVDNKIAVRYKITTQTNATSTNNVTGVWFTNYWDTGSTNKGFGTFGNSTYTLLTGVPTLTATYILDFYYPGNTPVYKMYNSPTKYQTLGGVESKNASGYTGPSAANSTTNWRYYEIYYSFDTVKIENINGTAITERVINSIYS